MSGLLNGTDRTRGEGAYCRVALPRPVLQTFVYRIPAELREAARPGVRVRVPFGRGHDVGMLMETAPRAERARVRDVLEILDPEPLLTPTLLTVCNWVAEYYVAPPGLAVRAALPPGLLGEKAPEGLRELRRRVIRIERPLPTLLERDAAFRNAGRQREAYETLEAIGGEAPLAHMTTGLHFSRSVLDGLVRKGLAVIHAQIVDRDPLAQAGPGEPMPSSLTGPQTRVVDGLLEQAGLPEPGVALLRGVTGSGKTVVYLRLIKAIRRAGRAAIVLVPEISLTPQTVQRFRAEFGDEVAVLHSALASGERRDEWRGVREGRKQVVVGTRSAVFAPVRNAGLIILDEEHDSSYKQSETPRYHARSVAAVRARLEGALCLLGSATPSVESWHNARTGKFRLFELPERATPHPLPRVVVVDLRKEGERPPARDGEAAGPFVLSETLRRAIRLRLDRKEQSILLLNRRGYSNFLQCRGCGGVITCRRCNVSLTYHRARKRLVCHHCAFEEEIPASCPACAEEDLHFFGLGTEQVERRLGEEFPTARILRMDVDTTGSRGAHAALLGRVQRREVDILLGTQMIAKGLDYPGVTLVGVINADVGLHMPDFRAAERGFQLLAQVAGRAGRGPDPGEVIVQTFHPRHHALAAALHHDHEGFVEREVEDRAGPGYPPHVRLANVVISGPSRERVGEAAGRIAEQLEARLRTGVLAGIRVVGPAPCPIDRLRARWRWHLLLKSATPATLGRSLRQLALETSGMAGVRMEIDRDPETLL